MNPLKIQYFDRKGDLLKTATFSGFAKHGKFWRPHKIKMTNHQTRKRSTLEWKNRKLNVKHDDDEFDKDELAD